MRSPYTCVYREIWDDERFWPMSEIGKLVYFFVLTMPAGSGLGCFRVGLAAMAEDMRMDPERFGEGFREGIDNGLFEYDPHHRVLWIPKYFERNPPANPNGITAMSKEFVKVPDCELKLKCYQGVKEFVENKPESFAERFAERFAKPLLKPPGNVSPSLSPSPSPSLSPSLSPSGSNSVGSDADGDPPAPTKKKRASKKKTNGESPKSGPIWAAYSQAYRERYKTDPVRNAKVNKLLCLVVDRLGETEAPDVAAYYVSSNNSWYVTKGHSVDVLLQNCEPLRTEWATGNRVTSSQAREADRLQHDGESWDRIASEQGEQPDQMTLGAAEVVGRRGS